MKMTDIYVDTISNNMRSNAKNLKLLNKEVLRDNTAFPGFIESANTFKRCLVEKSEPFSVVSESKITETISYSSKRKTNMHLIAEKNQIGHIASTKKSDYRDYSSLRFRNDFNPSYYRRLCKTGGYGNQFPEKLHYVLEESSRAGLDNIIGWKSHGRAFCVYDVQGFVKLILPKYFKQSKWSSFQRQLNIYGFNRITKGVDMGSYYHELFLRIIPRLSFDIQNTRIKGKHSKKRIEKKTDPDFSTMPNVGNTSTLVTGAKILANNLNAKKQTKANEKNDYISLFEEEVNILTVPAGKDSGKVDATKIERNILPPQTSSRSKAVTNYTEPDIFEGLEMPPIDLASGFFISSDDKVEEVLLNFLPNIKRSFDNRYWNIFYEDRQIISYPNIKASTKIIE